MAQRIRILFAGAAITAAAVAGAAVPEPPTRLFTDNSVLRLTIAGPVRTIAARAARSVEPHPATLTVAGSETHPIRLSARGLSRRTRGFCDFPPLRVEFAARPAETSLFERQRRLKLVTHCRSPAGFQRHLLLEYAAYRMFNRMSPAGLRARLAQIDYAGEDGRPLISRLGFFIEDPDDAARRIGMREIAIRGHVDPRRLDAAAAVRAALFQYVIGNLDWSMRAGPEGTCCHNFKLFAPDGPAAGGLVPVPYDFDHSGPVNAPYALPPEVLPVSSVRERLYRGYCVHNAEALAAAAELRGQRDLFLAILGEVPGLEERARRSASSYLQNFFDDIASDDSVRRRLLRTCIS